MGYYVQGPTFGKGPYMVEKYGATKLLGAPYWHEIPVGKGLVMVIDNGFFEAAAFAYDKKEFDDFMNPDDIRPKSFYLLPLDTVKSLTGYDR